MKIKVYRGCAVDGHNGIYTPMVFAERYPEFVSPDALPVLLAGPGHEDYADVSADDFINNSDTQVYEYNDSGDILEYELIDSDKITLKELNEFYTRENFGRCIPVCMNGWPVRKNERIETVYAGYRLQTPESSVLLFL